jgi:TRAP transporter TAXI family solute receptor
MERLRSALTSRPVPRRLLVAAVVALVGAAGFWAAVGPPETGGPRGTVVITAGSQRGVYYSWATALAAETERAYPGLTVTVVGSSGSLDNIERVAGGVADVGLSTEDVTEDEDAQTGLPMAPGSTTPEPVDRTKLVSLARVYDDYVHVVVRADSPIRTLADLQGRVVATGRRGSGVAVVTQRVLAEAGVRARTQEDVLVGTTEALAAGQVDALFWSGGLPTDAITDLARRTELRLLPLDGISERMRERYGVAYRPAQIPAGSYGLDAPVATIASPNLLIAHRDVDPEIVTALLDTMFRRRDAIAAAVPAANALDRRTAISSGSLPLHPAAATYYRTSKP